VNAVDQGLAALFQRFRRGHVRLDHELFNQPVCIKPFRHDHLVDSDRDVRMTVETVAEDIGRPWSASAARLEPYRMPDVCYVQLQDNRETPPMTPTGYANTWFTLV
jgi:hypothetical protein